MPGRCPAAAPDFVMFIKINCFRQMYNINIKGRLKSIARSTSVRCMELHDRKWCVEASNLKISVLPIVTRGVTIDTTHGCLGLIRQPHPHVIVMTGRAGLVRECKQMTEWSSSGSSCGCRAVSGIPIPNSHHQVQKKKKKKNVLDKCLEF